MINILKNLGLVAGVVSILGILGEAINGLVPWTWLTNFFVIIRHLLALIDWLMPTDTMITLIGISFTILSALWGFKAVMWVIHWFKKY